MNIKDFWFNYRTEILISSVFIAICIGLLLFLSLNKHQKKGIIGSIFVLFILVALNYILITNINNPTQIKFSDSFIIHISSKMRLIICNIGILAAYFIIIFAIFMNNKPKEKITTSNIALMGILVAVASVVMMFSVPIFPPAPFLKFEISGLIIYMVFLWFDTKSALIVSLLTNFIHVFMPTGSSPLIPFLDEGINFIATTSFLLPSILFLKKNDNPNSKKVLMLTLIGVLFTTIFMVAYNAFFNLPIVYEIDMKFSQVLYTFGVFNLMKWGAVALSINLLWKKLFILKEIKYQQFKNN